MKQKVVVRAIVRDRQGKTLFLRRRGGRPSLVGKYELPGGKLIMGEQPVDAIKRTTEYHTGLTLDTIQLFDTFTYIDPEDKRTQYLFVVFLAGIERGGSKLVLDHGYDKYIWKKKSELQRNVVSDSTKLIIGYNEDTPYARRHNNSEKFIIYTDGGSRGNPGPAAAGFVILDYSEDIVVDGGRYLGIQDSTYAEYAGVLLALSKASKMNLRNIELRSDSLAVVNQINGVDNTVDALSRPFYQRIMALKNNFDNIKFVHIRRDFNQLADGIVNKILDKVEHK